MNSMTKMNELTARDTIERERRGKVYDMKPLIENWSTGTTEDGAAFIQIQMAARDSAMGRPDELADALGYDPFEVNIERIQYILK